MEVLKRRNNVMVEILISSESKKSPDDMQNLYREIPHPRRDSE